MISSTATAASPRREVSSAKPGTSRWSDALRVPNRYGARAGISASGATSPATMNVHLFSRRDRNSHSAPTAPTAMTGRNSGYENATPTMAMLNSSTCSRGRLGYRTRTAVPSARNTRPISSESKPDQISQIMMPEHMKPPTTPSVRPRRHPATAGPAIQRAAHTMTSTRIA